MSLERLEAFEDLLRCAVICGQIIYQSPLSAKGLKDLARAIGSLDEAKQTLGAVGTDKDPIKH